MKSTQSNYTLETILADVAAGGVVVDVRSPREFAAEHAQGAVNQPLEMIMRGECGQLNRDQVLFVYCRSGARSMAAAQLLRQQGFSQVIDIQSLDDWQAMGGDVA